MIKVLAVIGTRPEAIKMVPVALKLRGRPDEVDSRLCVTAQHRQMLDQVLSLFDIEPHYDLDIMRPGQSPSQVAAAVLNGLDPVLRTLRPDWVLVQGDTTTVAAATLAAFHARAKVGHVEAGLRTHDKWHPFPEEINRRITGVTADLHFAPTALARENLCREGVREEAICVTGNPVIDALHLVAERPYDPLSGSLAEVPWSKRLIVVTAHRRESFGPPLKQICLALKDVALSRSENVHIVYAVHSNPLVQETARQVLGRVPGVTLTDPLGYLPFVYLMKRASFILTDSGGIQEEAPGLGKPVLVLRSVTERPEGVEAGTVRVVGTDRERIVAETLRLLDDASAYQAMAKAVNPYGDGHASERIVEALVSWTSPNRPR